MTISLSDDERAELEALSRRRKTSQGLARRARIVLAAAEGLENKDDRRFVSRRARTPVGKWRRRYAPEGLDGVRRTPPAGAPRSAMTPSRKLGLGRDAAVDATHWSLVDGSRASGHDALDHSSHLAGLRLETAASLGDLQAVERSLLREEKVRDIVGLYRGAAGSCPGFICVDKEPDPGPWTVPSPSCRCAPGRRSGAGHDYGGATARPRSSRPSTSPRERSSAA